MDLGDAIRHAYSGRLNQQQLAAELGVRQNTISRWVTGANTPSLDEIKRIEIACKRPIGYVLRLAGYVEGSDDILDEVDRDPTLSDEARTIIRHIIENARIRARV